MKDQKYLGNRQHDWEKVLVPGSTFTPIYRLRVPGGWLYGELGSSSTTFVPMPEVVKHKV